jgi:hypothetical protein
MDALATASWVLVGLFLLHSVNAYLIRKEVRRALSTPLAHWRQRSTKVQVLRHSVPRVTRDMLFAVALVVALLFVIVPAKEPSVWNVGTLLLAAVCWVKSSIFLGKVRRLAKSLPELLEEGNDVEE